MPRLHATSIVIYTRLTINALFTTSNHNNKINPEDKCNTPGNTMSKVGNQVKISILWHELRRSCVIFKSFDSICDYLYCQLTRNPTRLRTNLKLTAAYVSKYLRVTRTSLNTMPNTFQLLEIAAYLLIHIDLFKSFACRRSETCTRIDRVIFHAQSWSRVQFRVIL